ncbi:MAG TPA: flavodoxin domain-containing protein [Chitinophaga sp.]|uniref:flavodoxin domain-containing protein n=1 Tax=Chitinophaga sp. TaxID=1869181 RepID=UPI002F9432BE
MKGIIIYKGKYGATLQYADWLADALALPVFPAGDESPSAFALADYVIMGSSIYIGKLQLREWMLNNQAMLLDKRLFFFIVCGTPLNERAKLEQFIENNVPPLIRQRCFFCFLPGRLIFKNLSWTDRLLLRMGAWLARKKGETITTADYDDVKAEHLQYLINTVREECEIPKAPRENLLKQTAK